MRESKLFIYLKIKCFNVKKINKNNMNENTKDIIKDYHRIIEIPDITPIKEYNNLIKKIAPLRKKSNEQFNKILNEKKNNDFVYQQLLNRYNETKKNERNLCDELLKAEKELLETPVINKDICIDILIKYKELFIKYKKAENDLEIASSNYYKKSGQLSRSIKVSDINF